MRINHHIHSQVKAEKKVSFCFNGEVLQGDDGDSLASALIANDKQFLARSFKYGRKRGIMAAGVEEPNALVSLESGGYYSPNQKATEIKLYDGLVAKSATDVQKIDLRALIKPLHRFMAAGFYYKTFIKQSVWAKVEDGLRALSGFSEAPDSPDAEVYDHQFHHCDVLVVGGGCAGMTVVDNILEKAPNLSVMLVDERSRLGGEMLSDTLFDDQARQWHNACEMRLLNTQGRVNVLQNSCVFAWHDHNYLLALEKIDVFCAPNQRTNSKARQILHKIRAKKVILACGAHERGMLFENNDLINIQLAQSTRRFANEYNCIAGKNTVVYGNNDSIYTVAHDLAKRGIKVQLIDVRSRIDSDVTERVKHLGVEILQGHCILKANGKERVESVLISPCVERDGSWEIGTDTKTLPCDLLTSSGGFNPIVHLDCHTGNKPFYDEKYRSFMPTKERLNRAVSGSMCGLSCWQEIIVDAQHKSSQIMSELGETVQSAEVQNGKHVNTSSFFTPLEIIKRARVFLDMQNDVTTKDIKVSITEGYESIEHIKRYTAMGFGTDQGKTGNINGIAVASSLLNIPMQDIGTTTYRPAYNAVEFGALAGRSIGDLLQPQRFTTIQGEHIKKGAMFEMVGQWYRPWYFPEPGEDMHQAVQRECTAARESLAMMDASTLGKIDIQGKDSREFLDRVYTNNWSKLAVGKCRYGIMCNEKGMVIDDGVSACLADDHFLMTTTTGGAASVYSTLEMWLQTEWSDLDVKLTSVTDHFSTIAVVGPNARKLMRLLNSDINFDKDAFKFMDWRQGTVCGVEARVMRISFSGELAYEINVRSNYGAYLWQQIEEHGKQWNITPYGTETLHVLRAEKGYVIIGQDTDGSVTPHDANLEWLLSKNKTFSYIGKRSFTLPSLANGNRKQLVGLYTEDPQFVLPEGSHVVAEDGLSHGHVTSSYFSPNLNRSIAMAIIREGLSRKGEKVQVGLVKLGQEMQKIPCTIGDSVFYDPEGKRSDGND